MERFVERHEVSLLEKLVAHVSLQRHALYIYVYVYVFIYMYVYKYIYMKCDF